MHLAYVITDAPGATDRLLTAFAGQLEARGTRLAGVVQTNTPCDGTHHCDMDVKVLPDGPSIRISQSLGTGARGCRLDPASLERAVALVGPTLTGAPQSLPQLLIVNKFGKHEADGRGFRPLIGEAMMAGIPVLTGVNSINHDAFVAFSEGLAQELPATLDDLDRWFAGLAGSDAEVA